MPVSEMFEYLIYECIVVNRVLYMKIKMYDRSLVNKHNNYILSSVYCL